MLSGSRGSKEMSHLSAVPRCSSPAQVRILIVPSSHCTRRPLAAQSLRIYMYNTTTQKKSVTCMTDYL